jgi:hypothetical protein
MTTMSDWQWARRVQLDKERVSKATMIARVEDLLGKHNRIVHFGAPMTKWSAHDVRGYLAELEESTGEKGEVDPQVLEWISEQPAAWKSPRTQPG